MNALKLTYVPDSIGGGFFTDEANYLLASGSRTGATSQAQTFTSGLVAPSIQPSIDSVTGVSVLKADGVTAIFTADTSNGRIGINNSAPAGPIDVVGTGASLITRMSNTINTSLSAIQIGIGSATVGHGVGGPAFLFFANNSAVSKSFQGRLASGWVNSTAGSEQGFVTISVRANSADTNAATERMRITGVGLIGVSTSSPTAYMDLPATTADNAQLRLRTATVDPTVINDGEIWRNGGFSAYAVVAGTAANVDILTLSRSNASAAQAGFGAGIHIKLKSSTTAHQSAGRVSWEWIVATDASRASRGKLSAFYTTTEQEAICWDGDTGGVKLGFFGTAAAAKQVSGADLTNSVTSGGTDNTIANYTDLTTYATDAAAIRNNIYQLARKLKQVNDALRLYGLLT